MKKVYLIKINLILILFLGLLMISIPVVFSLQMNLTYDGNGNLITGDGKYREYNGFNQLVRVRDGNSASGNVIEEYIYHPTEDRILIKKTNLNPNEGNTLDEMVVYVNDNFDRVYDIKTSTRKANDTYYAKDENGIVGEIKTNGTITKKLYYHPDHLGSTSLITNSSGGIIEETFYAPYGQILSGGEVSRYQYEGKEFSSATEDYDFKFRKYNPEIGIFTQPEQMFPNIYDPQQLNRYSFERRNPYKYVDPDGKVALPVIAVIGLAIGGMMLVDYGLEIYHSFREQGVSIPSFFEGYEAGALRSGQDVGGAITFTNPGKTAELGISIPKAAQPFSYGITAIQIILEISSEKKSEYLKIQENKQLSIYPSNLPSTYTSSVNNYGNIFNSYFPSNNNFLSNTLINYNQINQAAQAASQSSSSNCMCTALQSSISNSQTASGGSSVWGGVKKEASNIWKGIKNIFGRIF